MKGLSPTQPAPLKECHRTPSHIHTVRPPGGGSPGTKKNGARHRPSCTLSPGKPPRVGEALSPPPALQPREGSGSHRPLTWNATGRSDVPGPGCPVPQTLSTPYQVLHWAPKALTTASSDPRGCSVNPLKPPEPHMGLGVPPVEKQKVESSGGGVGGMFGYEPVQGPHGSLVKVAHRHPSGPGNLTDKLPHTEHLAPAECVNG